MKRIEQHKTYDAKINWHKTDNLRDGTPKNGDIIKVTAAWKFEETDPFPNEWAFITPSCHFWIPERDLIIL